MDDDDGEYWDRIAGEACRAADQGLSQAVCPYAADSDEAHHWLTEFGQRLIAPFHQAGTEAARNGLPRSSCPVLADEQQAAWLLGWDSENGSLLQFSGFKDVQISGRTHMLID